MTAQRHDDGAEDDLTPQVAGIYLVAGGVQILFGIAAVYLGTLFGPIGSLFSLIFVGSLLVGLSFCGWGIWGLAQTYSVAHTRRTQGRTPPHQGSSAGPQRIWLQRIDQFVDQLPTEIVDPTIAAEELGDALEIAEQRAEANTPEYALIAFFVGRVFISILNTQRMRVKNTLRNSETK